MQTGFRAGVMPILGVELRCEGRSGHEMQGELKPGVGVGAWVGFGGGGWCAGRCSAMGGGLGRGLGSCLEWGAGFG